LSRLFHFFFFFFFLGTVGSNVLSLGWPLRFPGGVEAERAERVKIREEEEARQKRNFEYMKRVREEGWRKRRIAMGLDPNKKGDPAFDNLSSDSDLESDIEIPEEPEELVRARQKLASYSAREGEEEPAELTEERHRQAKLGTKIENVEWETLGDGGQRELKGAQDSTPNPLASAASVGGGKYQKEGAQDFDLMIKGQQVVNIIYDGSESSQDDLAFESHPLQDSCFDDLDLDLMD